MTCWHFLICVQLFESRCWGKNVLVYYLRSERMMWNVGKSRGERSRVKTCNFSVRVSFYLQAAKSAKFIHLSLLVRACVHACVFVSVLNVRLCHRYYNVPINNAGVSIIGQTRFKPARYWLAFIGRAWNKPGRLWRFAAVSRRLKENVRRAW